MPSLLDRVESNLGLLAKKPDAFRLLMAALAKPAAPTPPPLVSRTLAERVDEVRRLGYATVVSCGDAGFDAAVRAALPTRAAWLSHEASDVVRGATAPEGFALSQCDAVIVGGKNGKLAYVSLLRLLAGVAAPPAILWVGDKFEYAFSTLPLPAVATRAELYLHHHFETFFSVRDPVLVTIRAEDEASKVVRRRILRTHETLKVTLDELLPERRGPAFVELYTEHPVLSRGRHCRWRVCADVFVGDSFTTLHGAHDPGPTHLCQSNVAAELVGKGRLWVTVPNYGRDVAVEDAEVVYYVDDAAKKLQRRNDRGVNEIEFAPTSDDESLSYIYRGYGTSFFYGLREAGDRSILFGNHEASVGFTDGSRPLGDERVRALHALEEIGLVLLPHALPVLRAPEPVEFGFSFAAAMPRVRRWWAHLFDERGQQLARRPFTCEGNAPLFADELLARIGGDASGETHLIVLAPDWEAADRDPSDFNLIGDLVVRHRGSGDFDVTEFQSCWRNVGLTVDGFPHWIHDANAIAGRTRVLGRWVTGGGLRTGVIIAHGSGNLRHRRSAVTEVQLRAPDGTLASRTLTLPAFTARLVWLDELFAGEPELLAKGWGTVYVVSGDADVNCQLLTLGDRDTVSLQHMWGY